MPKIGGKRLNVKINIRYHMTILDSYCGAGGAAKGLHKAGFDIVGVIANGKMYADIPLQRIDLSVHVLSVMVKNM